MSSVWAIQGFWCRAVCDTVGRGILS